ncbi:hypothetical protein Tco_0893082 [Tanacetum coccineum]|uniref:Uncharacterized protein n=1 Tax=Tanacetum coccineum TaxID=301880 RepID=A0ABQ5C7T3_9ASTR
MLGPGRYISGYHRFYCTLTRNQRVRDFGKHYYWSYVPSTVLVQAVAATEGNPAIQQHTTIETVLNMTLENKEHSNEMWIAIEMLQQGESLNVQDVKTNLFWEFRKFTSRDVESMESYYSRFYKLMNELTRNNLQVTTMQPNLSVQIINFLRSAQPYSVNSIKHQNLANYIQTPSSQDKCSLPRHKGKEIAKPDTPQSESVSDEDSDPEQAQRDKEMQKNLALLAKYFKKLYKSTNNNLSNFPEQGVPLQAEQADWLADTDEEIDEQELEAHYSFMAKDSGGLTRRIRRHSEQPESINDTYVLEKDDSNVTPDSSNICNNDNQVDQNAAESIKESKRRSLTKKLKECKTNLDETSRALGEATSCRDSCLIALQNKQNELEKYIAFNDRTIDYEILQTKLNDTLGLLALKDIEIKEGLKTKAYEISVLNQKHDELVKKSLLTKSQLEGRLKEKTKIPYDNSDHANRFAPDREETTTLANESCWRTRKKKDSSREVIVEGNRLLEQNQTLLKMLPLPVSKSMLTFNINQFREIVDQAWFKHTSDYFRVPTAKDRKF